MRDWVVYFVGLKSLLASTKRRLKSELVFIQRSKYSEIKYVELKTDDLFVFIFYSRNFTVYTIEALSTQLSDK